MTEEKNHVYNALVLLCYTPEYNENLSCEIFGVKINREFSGNYNKMRATTAKKFSVCVII